MIYSLVHAPDIYSPEEFHNSPLYASVLLSALKSWMRNCVILVDNQNRLMGRMRISLDVMQPQDRKYFQVCLGELAKRNRIIKRGIDTTCSEETDNDFKICQKIVRTHRPDAFIVTAKNLVALNDQTDLCSKKTIVLSEYSSSSLFDEIGRYDFTIGTEHDYNLLEGALRYARDIRIFDRNIGRYWGEDYRQSLEYLFDLYRDVGEYSNEGQIEIVTGLVENNDKDIKNNREKYLSLAVDFRKQVEQEYPFQIKFTIKRESSYKNLPHPRYLRTEQFIIQLDAGFKFFNTVTGKTRSNVLSVKEMAFIFEYDYLGMPDYDTGNGNKLIHSPFRNVRSQNEQH